MAKTQFYLASIEKMLEELIPLGELEGQNFFFYKAWGNTLPEVFLKVSHLEDRYHLLVKYTFEGMGWEALSSQELLNIIIFSKEKIVYQFIDQQVSQSLETLLQEAMEA